MHAGGMSFLSSKGAAGHEPDVDLPKFVMVECSSVCNFRCPLCLWTHNRRHGQLQAETFRRFIDEAKHFARRLCFSGRGEPTLNPDVCEILRMGAKAGVICDLATNGSLLLDNIDELLDTGISNINVSIDADNPDDYVRYRVGGDFARVTEGMRRLAERKAQRGLKNPHLQTCSVVFSYNEDALERMKDFFRDLGFESFIFKSAHVGHGRLREPLVSLRQRWQPSSTTLKRRPATVGDTVECDFARRAQLLWNGDVTRCATVQNEMVVGNILAESFAQLWRSDRSRQAAATIRRGEFPACTTCEFSGRSVSEHAGERRVV